VALGDSSLERASLTAYADKSASVPVRDPGVQLQPERGQDLAVGHLEEADGAMTDRPEYISSGPQKAQLSIFFDEWGNSDGDVSKQVNKLLSWTKPSPVSVASMTGPDRR